MKAKAKLYGPMLLAALLCALVFATGAMKKPSEFELLNGQYMQLAGGKTRYAVADGDAYGALPGEMAGLHLPAGQIPPEMDDFRRRRQCAAAEKRRRRGHYAG